MKNNTVVLIAVILKSICCALCIIGATYLISIEKSGWGWLIFMGIIIGLYSVTQSEQKD